MRALYVDRLSVSESQSEGASLVAMPRDSRLFTLSLAIDVCLRIVRLHICMLWLTKIMQRPAVARRALAAELLRQLDQTETRRHRSHSLTAPRPRFTGILQRRQSSTRIHPHLYRPEPELLSEPHCSLPWQSAVGTAMDGLAIERFSMEDLLKTSRFKDGPRTCPNIPQNLDSLSADPTPPVSPKALPAKTDSLRQFSSRCTPPPSNDGMSSPDTASKEADRSPAPNWRKPTTSTEEDTVEGANEDDMDSPDRTLVDITDITGIIDDPSTPLYRRHWRNCSINSTSTSLRRSTPRTLRAQSNINGGLLEFKASAVKPNDATPTRTHRRNMSLTLPIPVIVSQHVGSQPSHAQPPVSQMTVHDALELQYKYRHIFIGTVSLYNFLKTLETSPLRSTTKLSVMKAFTALAYKEQLLCRQSSSSPEDWDLVTRITPRVSDFTTMTLARVQLGSISLQQFVDRIPFDAHNEAPTATIVEAFKNASRMDNEQDGDTENRAHAFRSWLLSETKTME
jgi:hypothetical protein